MLNKKIRGSLISQGLMDSKTDKPLGIMDVSLDVLCRLCKHSVGGHIDLPEKSGKFEFYCRICLKYNESCEKFIGSNLEYLEYVLEKRVSV